MTTKKKSTRPAIYVGCENHPEVLTALARVAKHLKRKEADTVRFLITEADDRIRAAKSMPSIVGGSIPPAPTGAQFAAELAREKSEA